MQIVWDVCWSRGVFLRSLTPVTLPVPCLLRSPRCEACWCSTSQNDSESRLSAALGSAETSVPRAAAPFLPQAPAGRAPLRCHFLQWLRVPQDSSVPVSAARLALSTTHVSPAGSAAC